MMTLLFFAEDNEFFISTLIGILGVAASCVGAYYGSKAYNVAKEIFQKGLKINAEKILSHLSLEIVMEFVKPFSEFKISTKGIWDGTLAVQNAYDVWWDLNKYAFPVAFPYFDANKGDIWDALGDCNKAEQADAFMKIVEFIEMAKRFQGGVNNLREALRKYLDKCGAEENITIEKNNNKMREATLSDFFMDNPYGNREMFDRGIRMMGEIEKCLEGLPKQLDIRKMRKELEIR